MGQVGLKQRINSSFENSSQLSSEHHPFASRDGAGPFFFFESVY